MPSAPQGRNKGREVHTEWRLPRFQAAVAMRIPLLATLCGLAAAAALVALRGCDEQQKVPYAPVAQTPASAAVPAVRQQPAAPLPGAASAVAAAPTKPALPQAKRPHAVFALSSDHQTLIKQTVLAIADHEMLEHEPRDDAWATESERLIRQELAQYPSAIDFDVIAVDCRQTLCAIQAFSYGKNSHREWLGAMDELLFAKTLESEFDMVNTAYPTEGGRSAVLTFFHRRTVKPQP